MPELGKIIARGSGMVTPPPPITLEVTPEMMATLQQISRDSRQPLDVVFTRAIALYQAALRANAQGKHVGYSASPDALEVEFTGLAAPERR
jgi:hypothetical protein